jgi:hypothetical protein
MRSTMMPAPLSVSRLFEYGGTVHGGTDVTLRADYADGALSVQETR